MNNAGQFGSDPRGPQRVIVRVERPDINTAHVHLECGHVRSLNPLFTYRVGDFTPCLACRDTNRA